jgi:hypothetical protein
MNFNSHPISAGNTIWFNTSLSSVNGVGSSKVTLTLTNVKISFNGQTLNVPNATVIYDPNATTATTTFSGGQFITTVPLSLAGSPAFLTGLAYVVPSNLPGNIKNITLTGTFTSSAHGIVPVATFGAAVYTQFDPNYNNDGIKPVASSTASIYHNSDPAGSPENEKQFVIDGGTGGSGELTGDQNGATKNPNCK